MALTQDQENFAAVVAARSGLSRATVRAWVQAEGGERARIPSGNPLNIMRAPGQLADYGGWQEAAEATIRLLNSNPSYAPILSMARNPKATIYDELRAIIESPWAAGHYTTRGSGTTGNIILGAYSALYPGRPTTPSVTDVPGSGVGPFPAIAGGIEGAAEGIAGGIGAVAGAPGDAVGALTSWVGDLAGWLGEKAALAFLYVVLSLAALALIVLGLMRATGTSRGQVLSLAQRPADDIPF